MKAILNFVGDIGMFRRYEEMGIDPFKLVSLPPADRQIGNFEFMVPDGRDKNFFDVQDKYCCSKEFVEGLSIDRFSYLGLANNHSMDYGIEGLSDTVSLLKSKGVACFGLSKVKEFDVCSFSVKGIEFAILGVAKSGRWDKKYWKYGPNEYDNIEIIGLIRRLSHEVDHVIVFPHWGTELVALPDPLDVVSARGFIDAGASAVIGHHPHVPQGVEYYRNGIIAYSLGSFIYVHEDEVGYSNKNWDRHYSISFQIEFSKNAILASHPHLYKYNPQNRLPEICCDSDIEMHFIRISKDIGDERKYYSAIRKVLLAREIRSLLIRFIDSPTKTIIHYMKYISFSHLKKIFGLR